MKRDATIFGHIRWTSRVPPGTFVAALDAIGDGVVITDREGHVAYINRSAERLSGWEGDDALRRHVDEILLLLDHPGRTTIGSALRELGRKRATGGLPCRYTLLARDGRRLPVEFLPSVDDGYADDSRYVYLFHAVEEDAPVLELLRAGQVRLTAIIASTRDAIITIDSEQRITLFNPAAEKIFRMSADDVLGRSIHILLPERYRAAHRDHIRQFAETGTTTRPMRSFYELTGLRADGEEFPIEATISHVEISGETVMTAVVRDISERKHAEEEHMLRVVAEEGNRAKDQILSVVVHELRNPLTAVQACAGHIEQTAQLTATEREEIEEIRRSAALMARLLNDLLEMRRSGRQEFDLSLHETDLHNIVRRTLHACRNDIEAKELAVSIELYAAEHILRADARRMQQVIWNLLQNAIKFTPAGGRIFIRSRNGTEGRVEIEVTDTGIGIEPEILPHIFDLFQRGRTPAAEQYGGFGIGLAVSRAIAEAHGGTLTAWSNGTDHGATFMLDLPLNS